MPVEVSVDSVCDVGGARSVLEGLCWPGRHPERRLHSQPNRRRVFEQSNFYRHFEIYGQTDSCIALIWDWGWTWYGLCLNSAPNGFSLLNPKADGAARMPTSSVYVIDSLFLNIKTGIKTSAQKKDIKESTIIQLDNVHTSYVNTMISATDGPAVKLIHFPAGSYIVTGTIHVPSNALITGEVWSQIVASGSFFQDMKNPKPMVKVCNDGDQGTVEISDMLFTSTGSLPGLVLMEWNVAAEE